MNLIELVSLLVSQHPLLFAALLMAMLFSYAQMRYYEGKVDGLADGEKICRKHHPEKWK